MREFDLVFVGNGSISYVSALKLKKTFPKLSIAIIGPSDMPYNASIAAGAMHAVYCEIEQTIHSQTRDRAYFDIGLESRKLWHELLEEFKMKDVITADSTIMYKRNDGTEFEKANFDIASAIANEHGVLDEVTNKELDIIFCGKLKKSEVIAKKFKGEFAFDAQHLLNGIRVILKDLGVNFIDAKVTKVNKVAEHIEIKTADQKTIQAEKAVLAAGSDTSKLLDQNYPIVPIYHAVGTSMVLDIAPLGYSELNAVVRTPNRGGAQCGLHVVPRTSGKFYLGAGNYISDAEPAHRIETIRYLIDLCENELYGKKVTYETKAKMLLGARPKSADGFPLLGACKDLPEVFIASGNYRLGLSFSPVIAKEIVQWFSSGQTSVRYKDWAPDRKLHSYASMDSAAIYYTESRISNLSEHGLLDLKDLSAVTEKKVELEEIARKFNANLVEKHGFARDYIVDPDMYAVLANAAPLAKNLL